ncbi:YdeI/OmpD-associated family protein [Gracilimonas tropica]|uniref:YdeI/OmpD-associated family protein n=1 Tax=Gracilimonas tropica TaxID=454600 RepID=UPI000370F11D|nr:DUF1801 domain-containing protein [Gracilimonas tropica]
MAKKTVDQILSKHPKWEEGLARLRNLLIQTDLKETIKWNMPVYTIDGKNVVGLGGFKHHFGIWFFQGALLHDSEGKLENAQEGKTKAMRQLRFSSIEEIDDTVVLGFVQQAIDNQKTGKEVKIDLKREAKIPPLLKEAFSEDKELKSQFKSLTPGRQREYAEYISEAKQEATKQRRLEKIIPLIQKGVGLNDKYQK